MSVFESVFSLSLIAWEMGKAPEAASKQQAKQHETLEGLGTWKFGDVGRDQPHVHG